MMKQVQPQNALRGPGTAAAGLVDRPGPPSPLWSAGWNPLGGGVQSRPRPSGHRQSLDAEAVIKEADRVPLHFTGNEFSTFIFWAQILIQEKECLKEELGKESGHMNTQERQWK